MAGMGITRFISDIETRITTRETSQTWQTSSAISPLLHDPGAAWNYGMSTDVLGYLVEVVSGMSFEEF